MKKYSSFFDGLKSGRLPSERFEPGGDMSSVFARDFIDSDKETNDLLAKSKFSAPVSYVSFFVRLSKRTDILKVCSLELRGPESLRHVHASLETLLV